MEPKKPILLLATSQDWGGVQAFLFDLAQEIKKQNLPVIVVAGTAVRSPVSGVRQNNSQTTYSELRTTDVGHELSHRCREANIEFIELKHMIRDINPIANLQALFELIRLFRRLQPQAVHLNSSMMGAVGSLAATISGVPRRVYCIGGWVFNEQLPSWKKQIYIWIEKVSAKWKDTIIVVHPGDEELAKKLNIKPQKELITIPNGIGFDDFSAKLLSREAAREKLGIDSQALIVGTVANAYPPKNLFRYLEVCKKVHEIDKRIFFVIIGEGPQFNELKTRRDELAEQDFVMLTGRRMDAQELYRAFDLFVLPSSKEGMSLTLLEAMTAELPCIATDVGANRWMLKPDAGLIVKIDQMELASAILNTAFDNELKKSLAKKAKDSVSIRFPLEETLKRHIELLTGVD